MTEELAKTRGCTAYLGAFPSNVDSDTQAIVKVNARPSYPTVSALQLEPVTDSGAEYSYWTSTLSMPQTFDVEIINPATEKQVQRTRAQGVFLVVESTAMYQDITRKYVSELIASGSLSWIDNILKGEKEKERILLNTDDFILLLSPAWTNHPDMNATSWGELVDHECAKELKCLAIFKRNDLHSLRDLRVTDVTLLQRCQTQCMDQLTSTYGVDASQIRSYIHYHPQFWHLHIHFSIISNIEGALCTRSHPVHDIVLNMNMDSHFYASRDILVQLQDRDALAQRLRRAASS